MIYLTKEQFEEIIKHCQSEYPKEACGILAGNRSFSPVGNRAFTPMNEPEGSTPEGSTPEGSTPEGSTPEGSTPEGSTPEGSTPKGSTPKGSTSENKIVSKVYKMTNTSDNPETCYFMKPEEQLKVFKEMRQSGIEMLGIYHSHSQSPAYPSQRDCEMAFYPEVDYVIISLKDYNNPEIRAFKIIEGKIDEEKIIIKGDKTNEP